MYSKESVEDMDKDQLQEEVGHVNKSIWTKRKTQRARTRARIRKRSDI